MKDLRDKIDNYSFLVWLSENDWRPVLGFEWENTKTGKFNMVGDLIIDYLEAGSPIAPTFTKYAGARGVEFEEADVEGSERRKKLFNKLRQDIPLMVKDPEMCMILKPKDLK